MNNKKIIIGQKDDFEDNGMKAVEVEGRDGKVLVCRIDGEFFAVSPSCTHYGAPLEKGIMSGDRIVCPWHHACFSAKNGGLLEPPSFDALVSYDIETDGDDVVLSVPDELETRREPEMSNADPDSDGRTFIIAGAGAAGFAAAQALREYGYEGGIQLVTREDRLPYDRPNVSKEYMMGEAKDEWMPLRPPEFYEKYGIETIMENEIVDLDPEDNTFTLGNGCKLEYDKALIATGVSPRKLDVPGSDLGNIFTLRSMGDGDRIIESAGDVSNAVVVGSSFIGMETAHSLREIGLDVTVIGMESVPFENVFGAEVGEMFRREHERNGVKFKLERKVSEFKGDTKVTSVVLDDGTEVETGLVIIGIGVVPSTGLVHGLDLAKDGSIETDEYLRAARDLYAAGDIASYIDARTGNHVRIEHWRVAEQQGRVAAQNMLDMNTPFAGVPFFWTAQAGLNFRYVGHAESWDEIVVRGDISEKDFIAFYIKGGDVLAASGNGRDKDIAAVEELMRLGRMPDSESIKSGLDLQDLIRNA